MEETSTCCSSPFSASLSTLPAVTIRTAPNSRNAHVPLCSAAAPSAMKITRSTSAPMMPYSSTRWVSSFGTAKAVSSSMNTNRLSTDNDFSTTYPVKNSTATPVPKEPHRYAPKPSGSTR
jgi:hypothetical protein